MPTPPLFDWNRNAARPLRNRTVVLADESLRDGLQATSVRQPELREKIAMLHWMAELGVTHVDLGFAGSSERAGEDVAALAQEIALHALPLSPYCAARTANPDIEAVARASQRSGTGIAAAIFIGSSPIRQYVEGWDADFLLRTSERAIRRATDLGLEVMFVTEDTTRSRPRTIRDLYRLAIGLGARSIVACDTCGAATPEGARRLIRFLREEVLAGNEQAVRLDWHGHSDRGLALANSLAALEAGADCVHGCILGIGERAGNAALDQLIVNLHLDGVKPWAGRDLSALRTYCEAYAAATGSTIPANYPVFGADACSTSSGIHAAAVIKAMRLGEDIANQIYSGAASRAFASRQSIAIGPQSGRSNVQHWLSIRHLDTDAGVVDYLLAAAKSMARVLSDDELHALYGAYETSEVAV